VLSSQQSILLHTMEHDYNQQNMPLLLLINVKYLGWQHPGQHHILSLRRQSPECQSIFLAKPATVRHASATALPLASAAFQAPSQRQLRPFIARSPHNTIMNTTHNVGQLRYYQGSHSNDVSKFQDFFRTFQHHKHQKIRPTVLPLTTFYVVLIRKHASENVT